MRPFLSIFFAIAMSLAFVGPLHAAAQCGNYGKEAAAQAQRSDELKCGFGGKDDPRFWNDPKGHTRWCVGAKTESKDLEQLSRASALSTCATCRAYANGANQAARDNVAFRCGFEGPRWGFGDGTETDGHFQWCMRGDSLPGITILIFERGAGERSPPAEFVAPENNARNAAIKDCKAKIPQHFSETERKFCRDYAKTAFADANINVAKKCGATPVSRWSQNEREHFEACIPIVGTEAGKAFLTKEEEIRRYGTDVCVQKGWKLSGDGSGKPINPNFGRKPKPKSAAATKDIEQKMSRPAGGSDKSQDNAGTNKPAGTSSGGSGAMERLGGGPSGGYDNSRDSRTPGSKSKPTPAAAAIITPAATATQPAASSSSGGGAKCFGRSCGGGSAVDSGFYNPAPARPVR